MARIFSDNEVTRDNGLDFINGVAYVPDASVDVIAEFVRKGYTSKATTGQFWDTTSLAPWDYMTLAELNALGPAIGIFEVFTSKYAATMAFETMIANLSVEVGAFDALDALDGGTIAEPTYADAAAVQAVLPDEVWAGVALVPVTSWTDTDTYNPAAAASYTFTAVLGTLPFPYTNTGNTTAVVEVVVAAS